MHIKMSLNGNKKPDVAHLSLTVRWGTQWWLALVAK